MQEEGDHTDDAPRLKGVFQWADCGRAPWEIMLWKAALEDHPSEEGLKRPDPFGLKHVEHDCTVCTCHTQHSYHYS